MIQPEDFEQRLKTLDWTLYRLAKEFAEYRAEGEEVSPASRYHSSIGRAIENPVTSRLETIEDIVQVLNGQLTIIWEPEKVVTLRLEDRTIEALQQRAENEGKTLNEIAKQLLLQALLGLPTQKPNQLTDLFLDDKPKIYHSFHPIIASAYAAVHAWLAELPDAKGYKKLNYAQDIQQSLDKTNLKNTAFQFYTLFPRHYFEVRQLLDNVIHSTRLLSSIKYNPHICVVDVGCAMGAATVALIEKIITLAKDESPSTNIEIVCVGIDPNLYGYALYKKLMEEVQRTVAPFNISIEFKAFNEPLPQATLRTISYFQNKLNDWNSPVKVLSNLFLMQLDVAPSIGQDELLQKERNKKLQALGLDPEPESEIDKAFWQDESLSIKRLLEEIPVDNLQLMTVGTPYLEKYLHENLEIDNVSEGLKHINQALAKFKGEEYKLAVLLEEEQEVYYEHPEESYWRDREHSTGSSNFDASFAIISSKQAKDDNQWQKLISIQNMELAWVKARSNVFSESFYDEVEIRLFEQNLEQNLQSLVDTLIDRLYTAHLFPSDQIISYQFVKGRHKSRPKQLTRLEEEILAVACLMVIGYENNQGEFYSYEINPKPTEDLYEDYWKGYKNFIDEARSSAESYPDGAVLKTDVQLYYFKIIQKQVIEITQRECKVKSPRLQWLLNVTLKQDLDGHEKGKGLNQGTITSGFYANLYLQPIKYYFKSHKKWKDIVDFYVYVDDIIIVIRNKIYLEEITKDLSKQLALIELELNQTKTESYTDINEFLLTTESNENLDKLNKRFNFTLSSLWRMNYDYRTQFEFANKNRDEKLWWKNIKIYQQCLYSLGIFITEDRLSRKIYKYLSKQNHNKSQEKALPIFPETDGFVAISNWSNDFQSLNTTWLDDTQKLKQDIVELFKQSVEDFKKLSTINTSLNEAQQRELKVKRKNSESSIRWSVNKLLLLGFDDIWEELVDLICDPDLFVIRNLLDVIVGLAFQGHTEAINRLWKCHENDNQETSDYIRAVVIEAFRFLPTIDVEKWQLIFNVSTEGKSEIEKLKATETWLYLGDRAKSFVQPHHLHNIVKALNSNPPPFRRLKKNYILILGIYDKILLDNLELSSEEKQDYLIKDSVKLAAEGKVHQIFKQVEPARVRQYYPTGKVSHSKGKTGYSSL